MKVQNIFLRLQIPSQHLSCNKNDFDFPSSPAPTAAAAWQQNILIIIGTIVNLNILFLIFIIKSYANDIYKTNIRFRLELKLKQNIEFRHAMTSA